MNFLEHQIPAWSGSSCGGTEGGSVKLTETSIFLSRSFPSEHFGKLFGLVMALSAIVSLLQFPLFKVSPESKAVYVSTSQGLFLASMCVGP